MSERLLTAREAAEYLAVHRNTVARMIGRGELPAFRLGTRGDIRIRSADLVSYLVERRAGVTTEEREDLGGH